MRALLHEFRSCLWPCPKPPLACPPWGGGQEEELRVCLTLFRRIFLKQLDLPWVVLTQKASLTKSGS